MPRTAIVATDTRALLALAPPNDPLRPLPLPDGTDAVALTLADAELAKLDTPGCRFTVDGAGLVTTIPVVQPSPAPDPVAEADVAAFTAITQATTVPQLRGAILAWMAARPGIAT